MGLLLGTYLPRPVTKKYSSDEEDDKMVYGVSSMQGWRETQEDAHNCILNYDPGISFFAVYDGHGGNEVSEYTSQYLPDYLKKNRYYILGNYENALKDSFVRFDCSLKKPRVVKLLRKLIKDTRRFAQNMSDPEDDEENITSLKKEALMPLEQVLTRYALSQKINKKLKASKIKEESDIASPSSSKETVRCSEVSSNDVVPECSSSKSNTVSLSESESEVSSSSSIAQKKSLSENDNENKEIVDKTLDSTSNGSEANNSGSSENVSETVILSSESIKSEGDAQPESSKASNSEKPADSATCSKSIKKEDVNVKCNGESVDIQSDEVISSSVENGELDVPKSSGKGKSLVKYQPKKVGKGKEKESGSEKNLFQEFLSTVLKDDSSESDSDDATFTEPESRSDDEDEEEEDDDEEEEEVEEEEEEEEDDEEEDEGEVEGDDKQEDVEEVNNENTNENLEPYEDSESEGNEDNDENDENEIDEDKHFLTPGCDSGCTALVALIIDNKLYVANAGDCRCVVSKNGEAIEMSFDHKPENDIELKRIRRAGGRVHGGRVNDGLNLSRAFGDHIYKRTAGLRPEQQMISPLPDIQTLDLDPDIEFMVLACDGIWNSMSSQEVVDFVRPKLQTRTGPVSKICEQLFDHCLAPDTLCDGTGCDNMTAIIVQFKNSRFFSLKKRPIEENEAEEAVKKLKTEDVTSTGSIDSSQPGESFLEKPSNSPDTTQ